ncbi:hypothetical protein VitviT2T_002921 [Vitis vinifera]|uniref:Uncharacterized protein n=1 Tax=Vitis vinifera TaxID=29760 RepID=A0ABY9BKA1_VITVI|nr:hypothetical protein VitviT2T_002921 [Vitis vinifera]
MISEGFGVIVEIPFSLRLVSSLEVRIHINQLSKHSLDFLGYLSSVRLNPSVVRSQMLENAFIIDNAIKKFDTIVPIIPIIGSLAKARFVMP